MDQIWPIIDKASSAITCSSLVATTWIAIRLSALLMTKRVLCIGRLIDQRSEPGKTRNDFCPDGRLMLADPSREHQRIDTTECRGHPADLAGDPQRKEIDGFGCLRPVVLQQRRVSALVPDTPSRPDR